MMPNRDNWKDKSALGEFFYWDKRTGEKRKYRVSSNKEILSPYRQEVLNRFLEEKLPKGDYYDNWGEPSSAERIKATIRHLMTQVENPKNEECKKQWWEDIKYLVKKHLLNVDNLDNIGNLLNMDNFDNLDEDKFIKHLVEGYLSHR